MRSSGIGGFLPRGIAWILTLTPLWYLVSTFAAWPVARLAALVSDTLLPGWTRGVEQQGTTIALITALPAPVTAQPPGGRVAVLSPEADFLIYGYGLPLLCALLLASRARKPLQRMAIGALALLPFQVWGVCFDWLKQVAMSLGREAGFSMLEQSLVGLGYQFGVLVFPTLAPVVLWMLLDRRFLSTLIADAAQRTAGPAATAGSAGAPAAGPTDAQTAQTASTEASASTSVVTTDAGDAGAVVRPPLPPGSGPG